MKSKSKSNLMRSVALHALLTPLAIIWLFPLWMMFIFSTMPDYGIFSPDIIMTPSTSFLDNVQNLQADTNFFGAMTISIVVAVIYTFLSVLLTSMAGWALARYRFLGQSVVIGIILGTITLPYSVVVIPQFIMVARNFHLANTWTALIVPPLFNSLGVLFMRQAFSMMPGELFDAARVEERQGSGRSSCASPCRLQGRPWPRSPSSCSWPPGTTTSGRCWSTPGRA